MSNIEWGPLVDVDRKRPDWLKGDDKIRWYWPGGATTDWSQGENGFVRVKKINEEGWGAIGSIRLPADHPHYRQPQPIDWSAPIEAVHEDGRVVPVSTVRVAGKSVQITPRLEGGSWWFGIDGTHGVKAVPWRIRNVTTKPVRTAAEMLERMEALTRKYAASQSPSALAEEARAIVAEMTPPVDPDLIEARKIMRGQLMMTNGSRFDNMRQEDLETLAVNALKRGRELERGA